ncbi:unnamed protein product [Spirodela intermedia]|uniref:polynucleotide adenylyltransferase n=1 Tax=Spirodela intermedia TaxID=51605 RepID=A0A7I8J8M0_SPIIN|nr:unnamed protein product [Spirodela intermedia]CAA6665773.1 unnamed protein product [Spirodela intermedia]
MESSGVVYETLDYLSPFDGDSSQQYAVFRSEITSLKGSAACDPATDYFSLDPLSTGPSVQFVSRTAEEENIAPELGWFRAGSRFRSPMVQLHKVDREAAVQRVFEVIKYIWPHCDVEVFGSFRTGLYLPTSDVDVVILNSKVKTPQMGLSALARAMSQKSIAKKIQVIGKARVPIIKFVEKQSGIAFDISFDMQSGPDAADFIKDAVSKMPAVRPLCLILKMFLQQRELNEVFSGGIGSYALITMLIAHLQTHWRGQSLLSQKLQEHNLGTLLVSFFEFYGRKLNNWHVGVSCKVAGNFFLKSTRGFLNSDRPYLLSIEDPQEPSNDIGRNSYNYFKVKSAFATAYSSLTDAHIMSLEAQKSILGAIIRPDPILLQRKGGSKGISLSTGVGDILCNWQLMEEEPLPREAVLRSGGSSPSRKRKSSKPSHRPSSNRNGKSADIMTEGKSGKKEKRTKKHQGN